MGQAASSSTSNNTTVSSLGAHRRRSFRSPFVRRKKPKNILSATFQAPISSDFETLNINTATVEQVCNFFFLLLHNKILCYKKMFNFPFFLISL